MSILIVGSEGSMGKRYQAILRYLGKDFMKEDVHIHEVVPDTISGIIIAAPTDIHTNLILKYAPMRVPILCEKPVTKDIRELKQIKQTLDYYKVPFRMMFQYKEYEPSTARAASTYDYFRHGNDGLVWDCFQVVALAKGPIQLFETSPIWDCWINGEKLNLGYMDRAYVKHVEKWFKRPNQDYSRLLAYHEKVAGYSAAH